VSSPSSALGTPTVRPSASSVPVARPVAPTSGRSTGTPATPSPTASPSVWTGGRR
jgi:hypothetical protein